MGVVFVTDVHVPVAHVLAGVDVEVLLLLVLDVEEVLLDEPLVLSQVRVHRWSVVVSGVLHPGGSVDESETEEGESLPSESHGPEVWHLSHGLEAEPESAEPSESVVPHHGLVEVVELLSVLVRQVVGQQVVVVSIVVSELVEPVEAIVLNHMFSKPWTSGHLGHLSEVAH